MPDDPDSNPHSTKTQHDEEFSAGFPATALEGSKEAEDIGEVWGEQVKISRLEAARQRARDAYGKALPVWRRTMYKAAHLLHEAATKDDPAAPVTLSDQAKEPRATQPAGDDDTPAITAQTPPVAAPIAGATPPASPAPTKITTVEINLSMPKLPKLPATPSREELLQRLKARYARMPKHIKLTLAGVAGSLLLAFIIFQIITGAVKNDPTIAQANNGVSKDAIMQQAKLKKENPSFRTLLPAGQNIERLGGWTRISPPDREPVYAYVDKIGDTAISISQQQIPDKHRKSPDGFVAQLASGYKATQKVHTEETTIYVARASDESQTIMFTKEKLLIFIRSTGAVTTDQWIGYVSSLQ